MTTVTSVRTPRHTLIQLSDTHIVPDGELLYGRVDTHANLESAAHAVADSGIAVAGLVLTGDLTDSGSAAAYRRLRKVVEPLARRLDAPAIYAMGNHDERAAFRSELLSVAEPTTDPCDSVHWISGLRIVVLDSTTPGHESGYLTDSQLAWLRDELARPAPEGTVLVLHHPPIPSPMLFVEMMTLREPDRLARVVAGSDVRIILSGHAHNASCGLLAGIPVWVAPATAFGADLLSPVGRARALRTSACSRIDIYPDTVVASVITLGSAETLFDNDESDMARHIDQAVDRTPVTVTDRTPVTVQASVTDRTPARQDQATCS
ncbi:metallophosphoesterase [Candidatus Protofrankia californiensis]|uniref:Metallophosphoesterase n=1 Tax=Candidatus Protofrankia californiensis TaxID=1839754 RepID=A0A1C3P549_9ACTN|nr:metallophosphoesterase [Candidatus Protofrankia californiensis]